MTKGAWIAKGLIALVGIFAGSFVAQELLGGGALGWTVGGGIIGASVWPLFQALLAWRQEKDRRTRG